MTQSLRDRAAIAGVGVTPQGMRGKIPARTSTEHAIHAFKLALDDAGLRKDQIDGLLTEPPMTDPRGTLHYLEVGQALGINPSFGASMLCGGATAGVLVQSAAMAVASGLANYVACVFGAGERSGGGSGERSPDAAGGIDENSWGIWGALGAISWSAVSASRHMALYGTKSEQLAEVAVAARKHALMNPDAVMRKPITIEDHQASRWIVKPLRLLDCCLVTQGGVCLIVTTAERARDLKQPVVSISGMGQSFTTQNLEREDWWYGPHQREAVERAYAMAGIGPRDVQVAQLYDNFTISVIMWLEHCGFCAMGEGGPFVEGGRIQLGGQLPINTHGGHLSAAHPEGFLTVAEGVQQVRGAAGARQVPGAEVCLVTGRGMTINCASALVLRKG